MRVVFAEKPSMGRTIAAAIGLSGSGKTHIQGKDKSGRDTVITWGFGHLVELLGGMEDYNPALKQWTASSLPFVPERFETQVIQGEKGSSKAQFMEVEKILLDKSVDEVVVATDPGREGELIALYVLQKVAQRKLAKKGSPAEHTDPQVLMNTLFKKITRLWPKSLTDTGIEEAFKNIKPWSAYRGGIDAAQCRSEADWIVGLNGTRALTILARRLGRKENGSWAVGRVMTPTLAILVNRELEIQNFKSKNYWIMEATFQAAKGTYKGKWFKKADSAEGEGILDRFTEESDAKAVLAKVKGQPGKIIKLDVREVRKNAEMFYDLNELQVEANRRFGFPAKKSLDLVQELYEQKVLSYPRTDSRHLTAQDAAEIPHWLKAVGSLSDYAAFVSTIGAPSPLGKRFVDDSQVGDHHALMPTDKAPHLASLSEDQRRIYDLVVRRFLAAFFPARIEEKTTIITEAVGETFRTNGTVVKDLGWSAVDTPSAGKAKAKKGKKAVEDEDDEDATGLPAVSLNEGVTTKDAGVAAKQTEPPKRYTEADLLQAMKTAGKDIEDEDLKEALKGMGIIGIGTPATRAATIEKLLSKGTVKYPKDPLVERKGKLLIPTNRGITLIQMVPVQDLKSPELTGKWESQLEDITNGKRTRAGFMDLINSYTQTLVKEMLGAAPAQENGMNDTQNGTGRFEPEQLGKCPKCSGNLWHKAFDGRHYVKCETADCKVSYDCDEAGVPTEGHCKKTPGCKGAVRKTKNGSLICTACDQWQNDKPTSGAASFSGESESMGLCPKCKKSGMFKRNGQYGPFVACTDRTCNYLYNCNDSGQPKYGTCSKPGCGGAMKNHACLICGTGDGQATDENRPPKPPDSTCPKCQQKMKTVWIKSKTKWSFRCDPCNAWYDAQPKSA